MADSLIVFSQNILRIKQDIKNLQQDFRDNFKRSFIK
jgi:hypothetical protein